MPLRLPTFLKKIGYRHTNLLSVHFEAVSPPKRLRIWTTRGGATLMEMVFGDPYGEGVWQVLRSISDLDSGSGSLVALRLSAAEQL